MKVICLPLFEILFIARIISRGHMLGCWRVLSWGNGWHECDRNADVAGIVAIQVTRPFRGNWSISYALNCTSFYKLHQHAPSGLPDCFVLDFELIDWKQLSCRHLFYLFYAARAAAYRRGLSTPSGKVVSYRPNRIEYYAKFVQLVEN